MTNTLKLTFLLFVVATICTAQPYQVAVVFPKLSFEFPVDLKCAIDSSNLLYVVEQKGTIRAFENRPETDSSWVFLDIRDKVAPNWGECGLLGLAFDPDFSQNGYFYVYYTADEYLRTILSRYSIDPDNPRRAIRESEKILMVIPQPHIFHKGGQLLFGKDGYLYVGVGDGGFEHDPENHSQNRKDLLGKILRIDVHDTTDTATYGIPHDNPYAGNNLGFREEIYAYGLRNPWRFSYDRPTGNIWAADVGQVKWEEVNLIESGKNYGWRIREGGYCNDVYASECDSTDTTTLTDPVWNGSHDSVCCVIGGYVYRGDTLPELEGRYIFADFAFGKIWSLHYDSTNALRTTLIANSDMQISTFGLDQKGELLICAFTTGIEQNPGKIFRLIPKEEEEPPVGVELQQPLTQQFGITGIRPNPFTHMTTISLELESQEIIELVLFDLSGHRVRVVTYNQLMERGRHEIMVDAGDLPSGMYYCELSIGLDRQPQRLPLIIVR
jgi:glucose/arabinose dehydrogenase